MTAWKTILWKGDFPTQAVWENIMHGVIADRQKRSDPFSVERRAKDYLVFFPFYMRAHLLTGESGEALSRTGGGSRAAC